MNEMLMYVGRRLVEVMLLMMNYNAMLMYVGGSLVEIMLLIINVVMKSECCPLDE